jgi:hypothetical protein
MMAMKDKPLLAAVAILVMLVAGVQAGRVINANPWIIWHTVDPIPNSTPPTINIFSPLNNTIYPSKTILFSFNTSKPSAPIPVAGMGIAMVRYSLDNVNPNSSSFFEQTTGLYYCTSTGGSSSGGAYVGLPDFSYSNNLNLTEGNHSLTVFSDGVISPGNLTMFWIGSNETVYFTIDTNKTQIETPAPISSPSLTPSPKPSSSLPSNDYLFIVVIQPGQGWDWHYNISGPLTLFYRTAEPLSWVGYNFDEAQNVTLVRNGTELPTLPDGKHSLKLYGNDTEGKMYASWVIWFSTHQNTSFPFAAPTLTPTPSPNPSPAVLPTQQPTIEPSQTPDRLQVKDFAPVLILASMIFLAIVVVGLVVYFRKRRG